MMNTIYYLGHSSRIISPRSTADFDFEVVVVVYLLHATDFAQRGGHRFRPLAMAALQNLKIFDFNFN